MLRLRVRVTDLDRGGLPEVPWDRGGGFRVHHRVKRVLVGNVVMVWTRVFSHFDNWVMTPTGPPTRNMGCSCVQIERGQDCLEILDIRGCERLQFLGRAFLPDC